MQEKDYLSILQKYWGYEDFRGIQREVIESIGAGRDTLCLMPTGGGKSITFQVPALAMKGVCIVFTPLISLMKDQVEALRRRGIKAAYITSHMEHEMVLTILENSIFGAYKFLYISPERLASSMFLNKLRRMEVCFITVDEAHCICQWGYDFRPSYLEISAIRDYFPDCPILALTATATKKTVADIQQKLRFREENVLKMSFTRDNLAYIVQPEDEIFGGIVRALQSIPGSCIIYTRSRRKCQELASQLNDLGFSATFYHAGLQSLQKNERQERWRRDEIRIMVATNAFGMGIDKPDVRLVLHADMPDSIEAYFQEAGRAGRDGEKAYAILLTDGGERKRMSTRLAQQFPKLDYVREVYEMLCCFLGIAEGDGLNVTREFNLEKFCLNYGYFPNTLVHALDLLDKAGYIAYRDEDESSSRLRINVTRTELFRSLYPSDERLILAVLRHYGGIFVDYVFIDEEMLSRETGKTTDEVYQIFLRLSQLHLISFIPRKHLPCVTFRQRRIDKEKISLPAQVYEERRKHYEERIKAMLQYIEPSSDYCRSRLLLRYFGEEATEDCGICDVCKRKKGHSQPEEAYETLRLHILNQLREGPRNSYELDFAGFEAGLLEEVVDRMRANGEIVFEGPLLKAPQQS
ncbi:MAG: RecQ family ATP-dependent DNA helicase [Bacteroidaceae bacterium]|nr:RecQ family ATP-dependent DNA helicase [Bacteroidaceae bacterium]